MKRVLALTALLLMVATPALSQLPVGDRVPWVNLNFWGQTGALLAGGKLCSYAAGTTTPQATWTDDVLSQQNANPMILGSDGRPTADIFIGTGGYKFVLRTAGTDQTCSTGTVVWTVDDIYSKANLLGTFFTTAVIDLPNNNNPPPSSVGQTFIYNNSSGTATICQNGAACVPLISGGGGGGTLAVINGGTGNSAPWIANSILFAPSASTTTTSNFLTWNNSTGQFGVTNLGSGGYAAIIQNAGSGGTGNGLEVTTSGNSISDTSLIVSDAAGEEFEVFGNGLVRVDQGDLSVTTGNLLLSGHPLAAIYGGTGNTAPFTSTGIAYASSGTVLTTTTTDMTWSAVSSQLQLVSSVGPGPRLNVWNTNTTSGQSNGLQVNAGTSGGADYALRVGNSSAVGLFEVRGDGLIMLLDTARTGASVPSNFSAVTYIHLTAQSGADLYIPAMGVPW